jgi:anti-sigma regulatory factor (Ser/Thr protein kinase)
MLIEVADSSQIASARRVASELAKAEGLDESDVGRVALIVTEMATNLLKHAERGRIIADVYTDPAGKGIELIAIDSGGGIGSVPAAMQQGFSTAGTQGDGLNIIQHQSDHFSIFSRPEAGTAMVARVGARRKDEGTTPLTVGAITIPYPGETVCGDAWAFAETPAGPTVLLVDGSGHGHAAEAAASTAVRIFYENAERPCTDIVTFMHKALSSTRGAALAVARIDPAAKLVRFVGVGNISGMVSSSAGVQRMVSQNGTAGLVAPRIREFTYAYAGQPVVILHSDGLTNKWDLSEYPGLAYSHPSLIAAVLYRDQSRGRDDASVVALRAAA